MWDLKLFSIYILCLQDKKLFFQYGIRSPLIYIFYVHKKKNMKKEEFLIMRKNTFKINQNPTRFCQVMGRSGKPTEFDYFIAFSNHLLYLDQYSY